jgi:hypothetical protein
MIASSSKTNEGVRGSSELAMIDKEGKKVQQEVRYEVPDWMGMRQQQGGGASQPAMIASSLEKETGWATARGRR